MTPHPTVVRRDAILLCVVALGLLLPGLATRDLWNPNEPTYGLAVVEMVESGEWWIPTVNGERFLEKPILYFWLARLSTAAFGLNEFALRLPSLLGAVLATWFVYLLGVRHAGRAVGIGAAWLFLTSATIAQGARFIQMDILATAAVVATVYLGLEALARPTAGRPWLALGLAAGLGFLAKGPVVWVCAGMPLVAAVFFLRPAWPRPRCIGLALGALAAVVALWVVPLWARGDTDALHEALIRQNFTRFVEPWDHVQPWGYYLKYVWIELAPWAWFLPLAWLREREPGRRLLSRISWVWLLGAVLFFSLSASKRAAYLMPVAPAVALLVAAAAERMILGRLDGLRRRLTLAMLALLGAGWLALAWAAFDLRTRYPSHGTYLVGLAAVLLAGGLAISVAVAVRRRRLWAPLVFVAAVALLQGVLAGALLPAADSFKSARTFSRETAAVAVEAPVLGYRLWVWRADYAYYLGRRIGRLEGAGEALDRWTASERVCVVVEQWKRDEFLAAVGPAEPRVARDVGSKRVELYCNR